MRALAVTVALWALSAEAQDFVRTVVKDVDGQQVCATWSKREYVYRVDVAGSARTPGESELTAIDQSFATWRTVAERCSDFVFSRGPNISQPIVGKNTDSENVITFREKLCDEVVPDTDDCLLNNTCGNMHRCWQHDHVTIALTTSSYLTRSGVVIDSDIEMNAALYLFTTVSSPPCNEGTESARCVASDIQNTLTHEIGHVVGLDHSLYESSTMYSSAALGETLKRVIDVGTAEGFCWTYPTGKPPLPCDEQAQQRLKVKATTTCAVAPVALALWPLALWPLRRRRRPLTPA